MSTETANRKNVKIGTLLIEAWGATMWRCTYYQVLKIEKGMVSLGYPKTEFEATGYDAGYEILVGESESREAVRFARFTSRGLKLCDREDPSRVGRHHWNYLKIARPGHREYTYGD